jgi:hypothetical protein
MKFTDWIQIREARFGPVPGAFGGDSNRMRQKSSDQFSPGQQPQVSRMNVRFQDLKNRVAYGKSIEKQIFDGLVKCGLKLEEPTTGQDIYDKIDGWWITGGAKKPIQIKYRDTGEDILFEVEKDIDNGIPGRDMIGKAEYYAVLNKMGGTIVMVRVSEAKEIIYKMQEQARKFGFDDRGNFRMGGAMLRVRPDPRSGQNKLMAYIPIKMFKQVVPPCSMRANFDIG